MMNIEKKCIYVDIDGTVADTSHREHYVLKKPKNWKAFEDAMDLDEPHSHILWLVKTLHVAGNKILIGTGRSYAKYDNTVAWFAKHDVPWEKIYMRTIGDNRSDTIVKVEHLHAMRADGYDPAFALEDRTRVVAALREAGLPVLQVRDGNF
jgi:uncharacterized HAD superfamily protein